MTNTHCRVGKVTFKNGTELRVLRNPMDDVGREINASFRSNSETIAGWLPKDMMGYFMIAWDATGEHSFAWRCENYGSIKLRMLPGWVADIIRERVIAHGIKDDLGL